MFIIVNLSLAVIPTGFGKISLYNSIYPGRERFPYGENQAESYNLSIFDLEAMFAAHIIDKGAKPKDEYRIILIGDSALWGWLLQPHETLAGQLAAGGMYTCDGRQVQFYNLGYPTISLTKDLLILDQAMGYQPDLVVWLFTLEGYPVDKQLTPPLVAHNPELVHALIKRYALSSLADDSSLIKNSFWNQTLIGQRRTIADLIRLQIYGVLWAATGIDQAYPEDYERVQMDFEKDLSYHTMQSTQLLDETMLAFPVLEAGVESTDSIPILLINQPIMISDGRNSDLRYNYYYPRWAYDQYRVLLSKKATISGWNYLDLWDAVPAEQFTNTPFHMTSSGEMILAEKIRGAIEDLICP